MEMVRLTGLDSPTVSREILIFLKYINISYYFFSYLFDSNERNVMPTVRPYLFETGTSLVDMVDSFNINTK